jgi:hypothetical protein
MNPLIEQAIVIAILCGAIGYLLARFLRKRRAGNGCESDCGCGPAKKNPPRP